MQTTYTENDRSMLRYVYDCAYFVVRKPAELQYFNGQNEDQLQNSPPAAKSPRREGPDSPTWQDVHLIKPSESIRAQSLAEIWQQRKRNIFLLARYIFKNVCPNPQDLEVAQNGECNMK